MVPIFERGGGKGIGYSATTFSDRFSQICDEHLRNNRAGAFAFIFYDFTDSTLQTILNEQGTFAQLDRLSGKSLSIFYLHSRGEGAIGRFNSEFLLRLGVGDIITLPCVVFFRLKGNEIVDVRIAQLNSGDLVTAFHELYTVIERYVKSDSEKPSPQTKSLKWIQRIRASAKFIAVEAFQAILKKGLEHL